ncbi:DUF5684 domain-containing protein [Streptococcus parauberis]|uniref:DUF5684 domain-containing protein n=3 Tax=Streptococcus parauberis TaxID=1348 RepID=A0A0E2UPD5_9STRE|nr:DUF5684 domain-containing protein [Streptococcus parauberis]AEF25764.1 membrane protein [Streptococcus parauberis KCTC 11537]AUT05476.1 hypothetical protein SPSF3K_00749 [Streptococcus parauberis]EGE54300.1 hypothetical protein SPB_1500 [Streptococcus parauberis NCFD 2020]EMF49267.1 hypothetical protein SPJ2_0087 [Streptococcus parauberis KRS-02109]EMG26504.1 hypothetical protein SPJ1_0466 [Streptococcus parauberis KRS-02083]
MTEDEYALVAIVGIYGIIFIIALISILLMVIGNWRLFKKAGQEGWKSIIPIYADFVKHEITFGPENKWLYFIGWVFPIYYSYTHFCYLRAFGASKGLAVLGLFFPGIVTLVVAFGKLYQEDNYHIVKHLMG